MELEKKIVLVTASCEKKMSPKHYFKDCDQKVLWANATRESIEVFVLICLKSNILEHVCVGGRGEGHSLVS